MKSFSGLYFFLRMVVFIVVYVVQSIAKYHVSEWYSAGVVLLIATLTMALVQPYKKPFMIQLSGRLVAFRPYDTVYYFALIIKDYMVNYDFLGTVYCPICGGSSICCLEKF